MPVEASGRAADGRDEQLAARTSGGRSPGRAGRRGGVLLGTVACPLRVDGEWGLLLLLLGGLHGQTVGL